MTVPNSALAQNCAQAGLSATPAGCTSTKSNLRFCTRATRPPCAESPVRGSESDPITPGDSRGVLKQAPFRSLARTTI